ncbi:MAG: GNAT family N-acetyltransferase [Pirellulales bacterium]|nr:GNAT family N-acetyltransferase [Pirellulales bacterium]
MPKLSHRITGPEDMSILTNMNLQLLEDEQHRDRKSLPQLEERMRGWLSGEYRGVIFSQVDEPVAYALYRPDRDSIYLRQFFVARHCRRQGIGKEAMEILATQVWPPDIRITIEVLSHNQIAQAFWKAVGFRDYAITMEKQLP